MKILIAAILFTSTITFAQTKEDKMFPKDSIKKMESYIYKIPIKNIISEQISNSAEENLFFMPNKKVENPELYTLLTTKPKVENIAMPNNLVKKDLPKVMNVKKLEPLSK